MKRNRSAKLSKGSYIRNSVGSIVAGSPPLARSGHLPPILSKALAPIFESNSRHCCFLPRTIARNAPFLPLDSQLQLRHGFLRRLSPKTMIMIFALGAFVPGISNERLQVILPSFQYYCSLVYCQSLPKAKAT
jgi:hypothetical protein